MEEWNSKSTGTTFFQIHFFSQFAWVRKKNNFEKSFHWRNVRDEIFCALTESIPASILKTVFYLSTETFWGKTPKKSLFYLFVSFFDWGRWIFAGVFKPLDTTANALFHFLFGMVFVIEFGWFRAKNLQPVLRKVISTVRVNRNLGEQCFEKKRNFEVFSKFDLNLFHLTISKRFIPFHSTDFQKIFHWNYLRGQTELVLRAEEFQFVFSKIVFTRSEKQFVSKFVKKSTSTNISWSCVT